MRRSLPVYPNNQTSSEPFGMSQRCRVCAQHRGVGARSNRYQQPHICMVSKASLPAEPKSRRPRYSMSRKIAADGGDAARRTRQRSQVPPDRTKALAAATRNCRDRPSSNYGLTRKSSPLPLWANALVESPELPITRTVARTTMALRNIDDFLDMLPASAWIQRLVARTELPVDVRNL